MSRIDIEILLERYLKGESTPAENELVEKWLSETNQEDAHWMALNKDQRTQWLDQLFMDIKTDIKSDMKSTAAPAKLIPLHPRKKWRNVIAGSAAAAAVLLILFLGWPLLRGKTSSSKLMTVIVPASQKRKLILTDGSSIWINAGSSVQYPETFTGSTREVYLTGEAYFDIVHDSAKPFIVHTGSVLTRVLGTAFDINADQAANTVVVTVTRGRVSVADGPRLLGFITPNQQIAYNTVSKQPVEKTVDADRIIGWQDSSIHFEDVTFEEAAKELGRRFKVVIVFANDQVKRCRFSGTSLEGKNIDEILKVLCNFNHASFKHAADGSIMIDGKGCE
jgi:transmembrane sensor